MCIWGEESRWAPLMRAFGVTSGGGVGRYCSRSVRSRTPASSRAGSMLLVTGAERVAQFGQFAGDDEVGMHVGALTPLGDVSELR